VKITFNLMNVGLGNNGGSKTLIKSANTLQDLGHDVIVIDTGKNCNTWDKLKVKHLKIRRNKNIPDAHFIIGTGFKSWKSTVSLPDRCGKKMIWMRGLETWNASEKQVMNILNNKDIQIIVNSICLQTQLMKYNISSKIIRPGHDFNEIYPLKKRKDNKVIIGGLFNQGSKRAGKRTSWIFKAVNSLNLKLYAFGSDGVPQMSCDKYIRNPSIKEKNKLYNSIDIWLAPTELEGLHIAPAEAMLTEATVVGTNAPMSGMQDYLIHNKTGFVSKNNYKSFVNTIEKATKEPMLRKQIGKQAREQIGLLGSRKENMEKMIKLFEEKI